LRKWVTGVSFLRDQHYVSSPNLSDRLTRSVRRASGLVLVGNPYLTRIMEGLPVIRQESARLTDLWGLLL